MAPLKPRSTYRFKPSYLYFALVWTTSGLAMAGPVMHLSRANDIIVFSGFRFEPLKGDAFEHLEPYKRYLFSSFSF